MFGPLVFQIYHKRDCMLLSTPKFCWFPCTMNIRELGLVSAQHKSISLVTLHEQACTDIPRIFILFPKSPYCLLKSITDLPGSALSWSWVSAERCLSVLFRRARPSSHLSYLCHLWMRGQVVQLAAISLCWPFPRRHRFHSRGSSEPVPGILTLTLGSCLSVVGCKHLRNPHVPQSAHCHLFWGEICKYWNSWQLMVY